MDEIHIIACGLDIVFNHAQAAVEFLKVIAGEAPPELYVRFVESMPGHTTEMVQGAQLVMDACAGTGI